MSAKPRGTKKAGKIRCLTEEETLVAHDAAHEARRLTIPVDLRIAWAHRQRMRSDAGLKNLVRIIRDFASSEQLDDRANQSGYVAAMIVALVKEFEWAASGGIFDGVMNRMEGLPVLYSPRAGKGAPEWEWARSMFDKTNIPSEALTIHVSPDFSAGRNPVWSLLACEVVHVVFLAAARMSTYEELRAQAVAVGAKRFKRKSAHIAWGGILYVMGDGSVLVWPDWLDLCKGLPDHPRNDIAGYQRAGRGVVQGFFADPGNKHAEVIIAPSVEGERRAYAAHARKEAIRLVVDAIARVVPEPLSG